MATHLRAFPHALSFAFDYAFVFLGYKLTVALIVVSTGVFVLFGTSAFRTKWLLKACASGGNTLLLVLLGASITVSGPFPMPWSVSMEM